MGADDIENEKIKDAEFLSDFIKNLEYKFDRMCKKNETFLAQYLKTFESMHEKIIFYEEKLTRISEANAEIELAISNMLLAIRQNEFLQAWFPAQKGYPAMKVVGKHPYESVREI